ncbi:hypothetical protein [Nonomuraea sp. NEAU-A123]|uniref:hypothetical protein n=1 Tax=Nonomuraea sp. NEAU-A123 TaxID=2839649 RepID=UPI001BE4004A|nr:hypothetical protein [Nonomuraea sp. NEAU-A123]MBT2233396.1 hypothetical protein [Nonomuraea sp. NEAU-A123]
MEAADSKPGDVSGMILGLLAVIWFVGVPLCLWQAFAAALGYPAADRERINAWMTGAAVIATAAPILAAGICVFTDRVVRAWIFGLVAVACVVLVLGDVYGNTRPADPYGPVRPLPSGYCAEHSGGGSECPGG